MYICIYYVYIMNRVYTALGVRGPYGVVIPAHPAQTAFRIPLRFLEGFLSYKQDSYEG